jgi:iron-sulfur cluster insertion protein
MINITQVAADKIKKSITARGRGVGIKIGVKTSGCSGMSYGFTLDEEVNDDDFDLKFGGVRVLMDSMSSGYLQGAEIDYREDQYGAAFSIKNPQAVTTCGCGSSFSPN